MNENNSKDNPKRVKRPRIHRAAPGQSEKVNVQHEPKSFSNNENKLAARIKNYSASIQIEND